MPRIRAVLAKHFGKKNVFGDQFSIQSGTEFQNVICKAITSSDVVLVIIGPNWVTACDNHGRRRLDNRDDPVVFEIEYARISQRTIIPVLIDGVALPSQDELPERIRWLTEYHARSLEPDPFFERDIKLFACDLRKQHAGFARLPRSLAAIALGFCRFAALVQCKFAALFGIDASTRVNVRACPRCLLTGGLEPRCDEIGIERLRCNGVISEDPYEECEYEFNREDALLPRIAVGLAGYPAAGKSTWQVVLCDALIKNPTLLRFIRDQYWDQDGELERKDFFEHRMRLTATRAKRLPRPRLFRARSQDRHGKDHFVSIFDYAGYVTLDYMLDPYQQQLSLHRQRMLLSDGVIYLLDPTEEYDRQREALLKFHAHALAIRRNRFWKSDFPWMAICVSKIDLLPNRDSMKPYIEPFLSELDGIDLHFPGMSLSAISRRSKLIANLSQRIWPGSLLARDLSALFGQKWCLFPMSSIGLERGELGSDELSQRTLAPRYVQEPFYWLLHKCGVDTLGN